MKQFPLLKITDIFPPLEQEFSHLIQTGLITENVLNAGAVNRSITNLFPEAPIINHGSYENSYYNR